MLVLRLRFPRSLATLTFYSACGVLFYASGCGDSTSSGAGDKGDNGGTSGSATGGSTTGGSATGGSAGKGASGGTAGKGGTGGKGGSAGKGGTTSTGGAPGGEGGEGGTPGGGAGGEGGSGPIQGTTCKSIHDDVPAAPSGIFIIDPPGNSGAPFSVYCDMTTGGGGWTLGLVKNSVDNGHYQDFASSYVNVAALATSPAAASSATTALAGWADLNAFPFTELRLAGYRAGAEVYTSLAIQKSTLRLAFGHNGYFLYNDANGYYWCGGDADFTNNGTGQENQPSGATADCKGHTSLGDGWDFSSSATSNAGLTVCGGGSALMTSNPGSTYAYYGTPGVAQAIWVR